MSGQRQKDLNIPFTSYVTDLREGATPLLKDEGNSPRCLRKVGNGFIVQTAFSIGDDPIAKATGMPALWGKIFDTGGN